MQTILLLIKIPFTVQFIQLLNPLKTSPEYTQAGVYGNDVL